MTSEAMAEVERRYSRKVGESFRRDKEHLALFEELAKHDDLDSSLAAMDLIVPSEFVSSAQGGNGDDELEFDGNKSEDNWLVTIPEVPLSPNIELQKPVRNTNISIRTSRNIASDMDVAVPASTWIASPMRLDIESPEISSVSTSKSPRPAFSTPSKSPRSSTALHISRGSSSPRSTCTTVSSNSPRLPFRSGSPSVRRSGSGTRASIVTDPKSVVTVKCSSPTFTRVSTINSSPGRRTSTFCNRPLISSNAAISSASTGGTKIFARGLSPSVRRSSPAGSGTGRSPSPSVSSITSRGISPGRAGCNRATSPTKSINITRGGSSSARSVNLNVNRKPSPSTMRSSLATLKTSAVTSTKSFSMARKASTSELISKPSVSFQGILTDTPANLRSPKSIISKSYDDPSNERRWSASSQDSDNYLSKSQDRGSGYLSGSRGSGPCQHPRRSHREGDHRIPSRNPTACEYGIDGRRVLKGSEEMSWTSPMAGHILGRPTTPQQDPAFEISMMRRFSDPTASRFVGYTTSSSRGGFKSFVSSTSTASLDASLCISLHHKLRQTEDQPKASSADNAKLEEIIPAAAKESSADGTEKKSHLDYTNIVKRIPMGFALKKEDVTIANHARAGTSKIEAHPNRTEMGSKISRLTALVISQGPVKIYQGLGDMEDMGANWCCGMQYQYRSFCKQHDCGIYKNFHDVLVVSNSTVASTCKKKAEECRTLVNENIFRDSSVSAVRKSAGPTLDGRAVGVKNEAIDELPCDGMNLEIVSVDSVMKCKVQHLNYSQEPNLNSRKPFEGAHESKSLKPSREMKLERNSDFTVKDTVNGGAGRRKSTKEVSNRDESEIIMMSPVSVWNSEISDEVLQLPDQSPISPLVVGKIIRQLKSQKTEAEMNSDLVWELDTRESSSRPLKPPDFFAVTKRHGEGAAISRVQSFNASEYDTEEARSIADTRKTKTPNHLHGGGTVDHISRNDCEVVLSPKTTEVGTNLVLDPRLEMEGATRKRGGQKVEVVESVLIEGSPDLRELENDLEEDNCRAKSRLGDDSNVRVPKRTPITSQMPAKLFPLLKCPQDGFVGGSSRSGDVSLVSSIKSAGSRVSSTSATSIDLTRSVDTTCSAHSQYDNALWDDPNCSGRFGDPMAGIPFKSIATLPLPLPAEVRGIESPGTMILSSREGATAPDCESQTSRSNDGFEKLSGYMRSVSLSARKRRASNGLSSEGDSKMHSRESSFDYFVDFLDSQPELELDGCGLTDVLVSAHKEAKKLENSPGENNTLRFIKRLDSRLSNNSLISDKSFESRVTDMSSDSSWESGKNRAQPMEGACQVMEQIVENANALSHGRHLSSFKFGQKKTTAIADLEVGSESPRDSEYDPSPKELSDATSDSSKKSAKQHAGDVPDTAPVPDESLAHGRVLPALKSTPGIIILSEKSLDDPKFGLNSPPRTSNDVGDFDGNLWEVVQIMEEEQEMEAELAPPAPIEFAIRDFTPSRTPARTPARTPSHVSKASSTDSHHSYNSRHSHNFRHPHSSERSIMMGMTRSPSVASKASSKYLDTNSDNGEMSFERDDTHRSYCGCTIL